MGDTGKEPDHRLVMTRASDIPTPTDNEIRIGESGYRRGFIQGIQFALNSLHEGSTAHQIASAQCDLNDFWRCNCPRDRDIWPPDSALSTPGFIKKLKESGRGFEPTQEKGH